MRWRRGRRRGRRRGSRPLCIMPLTALNEISFTKKKKLKQRPIYSYLSPLVPTTPARRAPGVLRVVAEGESVNGMAGRPGGAARVTPGMFARVAFALVQERYLRCASSIHQFDIRFPPKTAVSSRRKA
ncbi:hypothetical protein EVAR_41920_1 [Eumeta japonica]|uniref:Uncharacterized protein n=1 Tax=Eumeta variegata TaxID=151549 RepID=A0A4C1XK12_EUMVA|nr:hypothetical protein EVAR_41920_1 [Eumeta japonica]